MSDTLGFIVPRVAAGTSSTSNLFEDARALTSGAGHLWLTSDVNHLANTSAVRPVLTHQGFPSIYRAPIGGVFSNPLTPQDLGWSAPGMDPGAANLRVSLRVDTVGADTLPVLVLRCWMQAPPSGTESVAVALAVTRDGAPPTDTSRFTSQIVTNTSGEDVELSLQLLAEDLLSLSRQVALGYTASGVAPVGEPIAENVCTAWIAFSNTSNKDSDVAKALGITLSLEAP